LFLIHYKFLVIKIGNKIINYIFIIWCIIIFTLTSLPSLKIQATDTLGFDKIAHFFIYLIFSILFMLRKTGSTNHQKLKILILLSIFVPLFDELHQIPIKGRFFSFYDLLADFLGFIVVIALFYKKNYNRIILRPLKNCYKVLNTILLKVFINNKY